ncbi:MAG: universal stress protein [Planctomycetaceae bacterium]
MANFFLAYDASTHGDWVAHYAARIVSQCAERTLHVVHVQDGRRSVSDCQIGLQHLQAESRRLKVELQVLEVPMQVSVEHTICNTVPRGPDSVLICGTRGRERSRGLFTGSLSERMLRLCHCRMLAIHVALPGLLGAPRRLLLPVSGHPRGFCHGLPFLKMLARDAAELHLLFVEPVSRRRLRLLSGSAVESLKTAGREYCRRIEAEILTELPSSPSLLDALVTVSDNVPREIVVAASRLHAQLILLGASERHLTERILHGNPIEQVLRTATCDVAIYRGVT